MLTLIIGGARSGKSRYAQSICSASERVLYLATARVEDEEMRARIERHRQVRPPSWLTMEEPVAIAAVVSQQGRGMDFVLLDCLTVWLSNVCYEHRELPYSEVESAALAEVTSLIAASHSTHLIAVTNEVGSGIVPALPLGRMFRDLQGIVNQELARAADCVYLTVAGIPVRIKPAGGCP